MEYAIKILEKERELIVTTLKNGENEHLTAIISGRLYFQ